MTDPITQKLNNLSEDAQNAAVEKAKELNFDTTKGIVSLTESFTNLNLVTAILHDAVEKGKLAALPISFQRDIDDKLNSVVKFLSSLSAGTDEIVNLTNAVEALYAAVWQYRFESLSDEFLGFQKKLNQLKHLEVTAQEIRKKLEQGLSLFTKLDKAVSDAQSSANLAREVLNTIDATKKTAEESATKAMEAQQQAVASLVIVDQSKSSAATQSSAATASAANIQALEGQIKSFFGEIETFRTKILGTSKTAEETVSNNDQQVKTLIDKLNGLENQIKDQIERATGFSLFQSFQKRQENISGSKMFWVWALAVLVLLSLGITFYVVHTTVGFDTAFYVKLSFSLPLVFAITFCVVQYSRERRLEEEYAFRSNISISLNPYQELIAKLVDKNIPGEREKYTAFLIESVSRVFASPTDKIFDAPEKDAGQTERTLKQVTSMVKVVAKSLKH